MSNFNLNAYLKSGLLNKPTNNSNPNNSNLAPQHEKNYAEIKALRNNLIPFTNEYKRLGKKTPNLQTKINKYLPMMGELKQKVNTYRQKYNPTGTAWQQGVRKQRKTRKNRNGKGKL
jgi:uncharacterized coiled-coil DUF342 family protein